jgi:hypothetical protein
LEQLGSLFLAMTPFNARVPSVPGYGETTR